MTKKEEKPKPEKKKKTLADMPERKTLKVELTFTEQLLATTAADKNLATSFILDKNPNGIQEDEAEAVDNIAEQIEKQKTIFVREDDRPFIWDYQVKGFFKDACSMMLRAVQIDELRAYKKIIDGLLFVHPRKIFLDIPASEEIIIEERPIRIVGPKGERVALARSEAAPIGTKIVFEVVTLNPKLLDKYIINWLNYGILRGLGQWRNSGKGRFTWEKIG